MKSFRTAFATIVLGTLATSCSNEKVSQTAAVDRAPLTLTDQQKLQAADGAAMDVFGNAVALTDMAVIVAAHQDDSPPRADQGSVYVFGRDATSYSQRQKLTASDGAANDRFGESLAASGSTLFVGTPSDDVGSNVNAGSAYVFAFTGSIWSEQQKLVASDGFAQQLFGFSVAAAGDTAFASATGAIYVFSRSGSAWTQTQKLVRPGRQLVSTLAVSGDTLLVGFGCDPDLPSVCRGAAFVYVRSGGSWVEQQKLVPSDRVDGDAFGISVALSENTALIGAAGWSGAAGALQGSAYVFERSGSVWSEQQKLTVNDPRAGDRLGAAVALQGDVAVVGAPQHEHNGQNENQGASYLFVRSGSAWTLDSEVRATDGQNNDLFGTSTALSGGVLLVGSPRDDGPLQAQGSAHVFQFSGVNGEPCTQGSQCTSGFCSDGRCCNTACSGACDACSIAAGALHDGECGQVGASAPAAAVCAPLTCTGSGAGCAPCSSDGDCASGRYCDPSGACQPQKPLGRACEPAAGADCKTAGCRVCGSGNCADGFCCNEACAGGCRACSGVLSGAANGTCAPVAAGSDPKNACAAEPGFPDSCGADGECNGLGACRTAAPEGTACGDLTCSNGLVSDFSCNASGQCVASTTQCSGGGGGNGGSGTGGSGTGGRGGSSGSGGSGGASGAGGGGGTGGTGGSGGNEACIRVTPDGNDAAAVASHGTLPFGDIQAAIDFADANRDVATRVCVANGPVCTDAVYAGPDGADLHMRSGIDVLGRFQSTTWERCGFAADTIVELMSASGVVFGDDIDEPTTLDGFGFVTLDPGSSNGAVTGVTVDGAHGAELVDLAIASEDDDDLALVYYGIDVRNGGEANIVNTAIFTPRTFVEGVGVRSIDGRVTFTDGSIQVRGPADADDITGPVSIIAVALQGSPGSRIERSVLTTFVPTSSFFPVPAFATVAGVFGSGDCQNTLVEDNEVSHGLNNGIPGSFGIAFSNCNGSGLRIANNTVGTPEVGISTSTCTALVAGNFVRSIGTRDKTSVGIECRDGSRVIDNDVSTLNNAGGITAPGSTNKGIGISCNGCAEVSRNQAVGLSEVQCLRNCVYGGTGLSVSGNGTLIDANRILGGCGGGPVGGAGSIGMAVTGNVRIQNNILTGASDCPFSPGQENAIGYGLVIDGSDIDVHSNFIDGGTIASSVCTSAGIRLQAGGARIRNNILLGGTCGGAANIEESDGASDPSVVENNDFVDGPGVLYRDQGTVDPNTPEAINALTDMVSRDNFSALCTFPIAGDQACVDRGTTTGAPALDIDGEPRSATFPDVGPDEFGEN